MLVVYHKHFMIRVQPFINRQGNTSYFLDVYDFSFKGGGAFVYCLIRYQWQGGSQYLLCADSDGLCFPSLVCVKELLQGFNWSCVRRALKSDPYAFRAFPHYFRYEVLRYGK